MIIPLSFQYVFVDGLTALECPKTGLALSVTRKSLFVISAAVLPSFFGAKAAFLLLTESLLSSQQLYSCF